MKNQISESISICPGSPLPLETTMDTEEDKPSSEMKNDDLGNQSTNDLSCLVTAM